MTSHLTVLPVPAMGAEDVVVDQRGQVWTGTEDGAIWRLSPDGKQIERVSHTGGRPLGIEIDPAGDLLVADARAGLLRVSATTGAAEVIRTEAEGIPLKFCNNAAIAGDGTVYFSDSSRHFGIEQWKDDFVQNTRTGRLFRLTEDGTLTTLLDGLAFANGVALSRDEQFVAVAETGARAVRRYWLDGREGPREFLVDDLPGYPDNIARGSDGRIWITIASPRDPVVEAMQRAPLGLRKAVTRIPERLQPKPQRTVHVQAYDDHGTLVHDVDVDTPDFHMATGVREHHGRVWLGSLHEPAVAFVDL